MSAALQESPPFVLREALPHATSPEERAQWERDQAFVIDSWLQSERERVGYLEGPHFVRWQKQMQRDVLARPSTRVLCACPDGDPDTILGWAALSDSTLFYVYVKRGCRRFGVASALLAPLRACKSVVYAALPLRVYDETSRAYLPFPTSKIPSNWRFLYRANFYPATS